MTEPFITMTSIPLILISSDGCLRLIREDGSTELVMLEKHPTSRWFACALTLELGKLSIRSFFRCDDGSIIYPRRGSGWYWWPEFLAAKSFSERIGCVIFECVEWWRYDNDIDIAPFGWVEHYYHARQEYIAEARERGVEKRR